MCIRDRASAMTRMIADERRRITEGVRLRVTMQHILTRQHARLERLSARLARVRPEAVYAMRHARLQRAGERLGRAMETRLREARRMRGDVRSSLGEAWRIRLERQRDRVTQASRELAIVAPDNVLRRGFSVTFGPDGTAIQSASQVRAGDEITTRVADGSLRSRVSGSEERAAAVTRPLPSRPTPAKRAPRRGDDSQMDLFG